MNFTPLDASLCQHRTTFIPTQTQKCNICCISLAVVRRCSTIAPWAYIPFQLLMYLKTESFPLCSASLMLQKVFCCALHWLHCAVLTIWLLQVIHGCTCKIERNRVVQCYECHCHMTHMAAVHPTNYYQTRVTVTVCQIECTRIYKSLICIMFLTVY